MLRMIGGVSVFVFALAAGCGGSNPVPTTPDLATPADLAVPPVDLVTPSDLAPPVVAVPAGCNTTTTVTGTLAYSTITGTNGTRCMGAGCHNQAQSPVFSTRPTFMAAMINKTSSSAYQFVVPNMPDKSYLLYKLRGTQLSVPNGNGGQMPTGGTFLNDTEFCTVYNWVLHGAPVN